MKKLIKKTVLLTTILSLSFCISIWVANRTYASIINGEEYGCSNPESPISIVSTNGNLTNFRDALGDIYTAYTNEVNEYISLQNQGLTKIKTFTTTTQGDNMDNHFITEYFLSGYQKVKLPDTALIRVNDKYTLELLSLEKYLQGTQKTTDDYYLMKEKAKKKGQETLENSRKQQAEALKDKQEIGLNNQINAEMDIYSNDYNKNHNSQLPYTADYFNNYCKTEIKKSQDKIWASFDNERNYVQQWLNKHNLTLKQLRDMRYTTENLEENTKKYGKQMVQADIYFKWIENGTLPKNCSYGDWIRYMLRPGNMMPGWNWLAIWSDNVDFTPITEGTLNGWATYADISRTNEEIYKMIEKDMEVIANYKSISVEERLIQIEMLSNGMITPLASTDLAKKCYPGYKSRTELLNKLKNKWNTEYLPSIKE